MAKSLGGVFLPDADYTLTGAINVTGALTSTSATMTGATITSPVINGAITGTSVGSKLIKTAAVAVSGTAVQGGVQAWQNPEATAILVLRAVLDITTQSTSASTLDIGVTETSATTASDTLLDGISGASAAVFDSMNAALDAGANAKAQKLASAKWVTFKAATGDPTALVGVCYISYLVV